MQNLVEIFKNYDAEEKAVTNAELLFLVSLYRKHKKPNEKKSDREEPAGSNKNSSYIVFKKSELKSLLSDFFFIHQQIKRLP